MIRTAVETDKVQVIDLARLFIDGMIGDYMAFDEASASAHFDLLFKVAKTLVYEIDGKIVGLIAGIVSAKYFCSGKSLQELVWFVHPDYRTCGVRLLRAFEQLARDEGCDDIMLTHLDGNDLSGVYEKLGYKKVQITYLKGV